MNQMKSPVMQSSHLFLKRVSAGFALGESLFERDQVSDALLVFLLVTLSAPLLFAATRGQCFGVICISCENLLKIRDSIYIK